VTCMYAVAVVDAIFGMLGLNAATDERRFKGELDSILRSGNLEGSGPRVIEPHGVAIDNARLQTNLHQCMPSE
jgi:hypothetical protein